MISRTLLAVLALLSCHAANAGGFVGNANGVEGRYQIFQFTNGGGASKQVSHTTSPVAWPSAIQSGSTITVYASENVSGKWQNIRRWVSMGGAYTDMGVVFSANASEPNGFGPSTLNFDGTTYRLFYTIQGTSIGASIALATSSDGVTFTRQGVIYTPGSEAPGGITASYACTDGSTSYLLMNGFASGLATSSAILATASSPSGPYAYSSTILSPSASSGTITGVAGNNFAQFTGTIRVGVPIVVNDGSGAVPYIPTEINGTGVFFDRPLERTVTSISWGENIRNKADVSFVRKDASGNWTGAVTGYGAFSGVLSEYTAKLISSGNQAGPWSIDYGYEIIPYFNSGKFSTENPEPIRSDASCQ